MNKYPDPFVPAWPRAALAALATLALVACGGGGDSDPPFFVPADYPVDATVSAYWQAPQRHSLQGTLGSDTIGLELSRTPIAGAFTFEGMPALRADESASFDVNGGVTGVARGSVYFAVSPFRLYGQIDTDSGEYAVNQQTANLPARASIGQSGPFGVATLYSDASKTTVVDSITTTWSLQADTATTAQLCFNEVSVLAPGETSSECLRINAAGDVLGIVLRFDIDGTVLTLQ